MFRKIPLRHLLVHFSKSPNTLFLELRLSPVIRQRYYTIFRRTRKLYVPGTPQEIDDALVTPSIDRVSKLGKAYNTFQNEQIEIRS